MRSLKFICYSSVLTDTKGPSHGVWGHRQRVVGGDGDQERHVLYMGSKQSQEGVGHLTSGERAFQAEGTACGNADEKRILWI